MANLLIIFSKKNGSLIRSIIRALTLVVTAFLSKLDASQVASIQLAVETVLQGGVLTPLGDQPAPPAE